VLVYAIALLGLNTSPDTGQISLGHGAFYALGAYCPAILIDSGRPYWRYARRGGVCLVAGFLFGCRRLRLEGLYLCARHLRARAWRCAAAEVPSPREVDRRRAGIVIAKTRSPVRIRWRRTGGCTSSLWG